MTIFFSFVLFSLYSRTVASQVKNLRTEQLDLFQNHLSSIGSSLDVMKTIKESSIKILKDLSSNSNDHVGREKRRLAIISQKLGEFLFIFLIQTITLVKVVLNDQIVLLPSVKK